MLAATANSRPLPRLIDKDRAIERVLIQWVGVYRKHPPISSPAQRNCAAGAPMQSRAPQEKERLTQIKGERRIAKGNRWPFPKAEECALAL